MVNLVFSYASLALLFVHGLVLTPLYLSVIPVPLYGSWLAFGAIFAALELIDPGIGQIVQQRTAHALGSGDARRLREVVGTGGVVSCFLASCLLLALPFAGFAPEMVRYSGNDSGELVTAFTIGVLARAAGVASAGVTAAGMGLQLARMSGTIHLLGGVLSIAVTVSLLFHGAGLVSLPAGLLARGVLVSVCNAAGVTFWTKRTLGFAPGVTWAETRAQFGITGFTFAARAGASVLGRLDTLIAAWFFGPEQAAVVGITGRAAELVRAVAERPAQSAAPALAHMVGEGSPRTGQMMKRLLLISSGIAAVGMGSVIAANDRFVGAWVGGHLYGGMALTIAIALAGGTAVIGSAAHQMLVSSGALKGSAVLTIKEAGLRLPLQVAFPMVFGVAGIPSAYAVASALSLVIWVPPTASQLSLEWASQVRRWLVSGLRQLAVAAGLGFLMALTARWVLGAEPGWLSLALVGSTAAVAQILACAARFETRVELMAMLSGGRGLTRRGAASVVKGIE